MTRGRAAGPNKHGVSPPEGCTIWGIDGDTLQVATAYTQKNSFERSLLIDSQRFDPLVTEMVRQSGTLKAWFAYRVSTRERRTGEKIITAANFRPVWALIQKSAAAWTEQYTQCRNHSGNCISK